MTDINCKKIIRNDGDIIVLADDVFSKIIFGIISLLVGLIATKTSELPELRIAFILFIIAGLHLIFGKNETITIDKNFHTIYLQSNWFLIIDGKIKKIKFSEIITPTIAEETDSEGGKTWNIDLILTSQEKPQRIFCGEDEKEVKALVDKIFNFLGVK